MASNPEAPACGWFFWPKAQLAIAPLLSQSVFPPPFESSKWFPSTGCRGAPVPRAPGVTRRGAQWSLDGAPAPALAPWAAPAAFARAAPTPGKAGGWFLGPGGRRNLAARARSMRPECFRLQGTQSAFLDGAPGEQNRGPLRRPPYLLKILGSLGGSHKAETLSAEAGWWRGSGEGRRFQGDLPGSFSLFQSPPHLLQGEWRRGLARAGGVLFTLCFMGWDVGVIHPVGPEHRACPISAAHRARAVTGVSEGVCVRARMFPGFFFTKENGERGEGGLRVQNPHSVCLGSESCCEIE